MAGIVQNGVFFPAGGATDYGSSPGEDMNNSWSTLWIIPPAPNVKVQNVWKPYHPPSYTPQWHALN